jgi:hypothetical protein
MRSFSLCAPLLGLSIALAACSDDETEATTTSGSTAASGSVSASSSSSSSASTGSGGMGGEGGGGITACQGATDDFTGFDPASMTDFWEVDGVVAPTDNPDPAVVMSLSPNLYSGLFSAAGAPASGCFTSIRVEATSSSALVSLEILEALGTGPKVILEVDAATGDFVAVDIVDGAGNGTMIGSGTVTALEGMRIVVAADQATFEVLDGGTWIAAGTLDPLPAWMAGDVNLAFGARDDSDEPTIFDDFNLDPPAP